VNNNMKQLMKLLLDTGLQLVDSGKREKPADNLKDRVADWRDTAKNQYENAMNRLERIAYAARGKEPWTSKAAPFLVGLGVGVGVAMLFAPASGEETRHTIVAQAGNVRDRVSAQASNIRSRVSEQVSDLAASA
jgi:gas vesicle protein